METKQIAHKDITNATPWREKCTQINLRVDLQVSKGLFTFAKLNYVKIGKANYKLNHKSCKPT